jgi:hypothetical protein
MVQVWLKQPLSPAALEHVARNCGGEPHVHDGPAPFGRGYVQRLQLRQPTPQALVPLVTSEDALVNALELSLDWTFDADDEHERAYRFVDQYLVKRYHRRAHGVVHVGRTRYTGPRASRTNAVVYPTKESKVTGEALCVHFDWRVRTADAVRAAGFANVSDLVNLDHRRFWRERLLFQRLHPRDLGRMFWNHRLRTSRREAWMRFYCGGRVAYDVHLRTGQLMIRGLRTTQQVIDLYRDKFKVRRCLEVIEVGHLLPPAHCYNHNHNTKVDSPHTNPLMQNEMA